MLLLDDDDVSVEKHSFQDFERNALEAIFLQRIEYSRGIVRPCNKSRIDIRRGVSK